MVPWASGDHRRTDVSRSVRHPQRGPTCLWCVESLPVDGRPAVDSTLDQLINRIDHKALIVPAIPDHHAAFFADKIPCLTELWPVSVWPCWLIPRSLIFSDYPSRFSSVIIILLLVTLINSARWWGFELWCHLNLVLIINFRSTLCEDTISEHPIMMRGLEWFPREPHTRSESWVVGRTALPARATRKP